MKTLKTFSTLFVCLVLAMLVVTLPTAQAQTPTLTPTPAPAPTPAASPLPPLPDQYSALGISLNPGAAPPVQGDVEWGKLLGGNVYGGMAAGIIPDTGISPVSGLPTGNRGTLSLTTAQAVVRVVAWRNKYLALVLDGKGGIASEGTTGNTGGAFTGAGGVVAGIHTFPSFGKISLYAGLKAVKTTLQPNSFGPAIGLVFTPK